MAVTATPRAPIRRCGTAATDATKSACGRDSETEWEPRSGTRALIASTEWPETLPGPDRAQQLGASLDLMIRFLRAPGLMTHRRYPDRVLR